MKKKAVEDAKKAFEFTAAIQNKDAEEVDVMLKETMKVKREAITSEVVGGGNSSVHISNNAIDLDPSSPPHSNLDDIPLSRVYQNLEKALPLSPSTKTSKKPDDVDGSEKPTINERIGSLLQRRLDVCQNLPTDHWLQRPCVKPFQTLLRDEKFEEDSMQTTFDNTTSSHPKPTTLESPHTIRKLEDNLGGELPETPQKASETAPDIAVSEN